ncbi:MAG: hypothetical protein WCJ54_02630, partial [Actinomycetota bacterium]
GQHDPTEIPILFKKLKESNSDFVIGERPFSKDMPFVKKQGNRFFHVFSKYSLVRRGRILISETKK